MLKIGVTGSFGSGKTTVAAMFRKCGAAVVDADGIVHRLLKEDRGCRKAIGRLFGQDVLNRQGVDRIKLARIVFSDRRALRRLEAVVHPLVWRETLKGFRAAGHKAVVIDAPLLLEAKWQEKVDVVVVVKAKVAQQVQRARARMGLRRTDVIQRIRHQMPLSDKLKYADFVVNNSGTKTDTHKQVKEIWKRLNAKTNQEESAS